MDYSPIIIAFIRLNFIENTETLSGQFDEIFDDKDSDYHDKHKQRFVHFVNVQIAV